MERICPRDGSNLASTLHREVQLDVCNACGGVWVDSEQLSRVLGVEDPYVLVDLLREAPASDHAANRCPLCDKRTRGNARICPNCSVCLLSDCPSCNTRLKVVDVHECPIDVCPSCFGVWFDSEEVMAVRARLVKMGIGVRDDRADGKETGVEGRKRETPGAGLEKHYSDELFAVDEATDDAIESAVSFDPTAAAREATARDGQGEAYSSREIAVEEAVDAAIEEQVSFGGGSASDGVSRTYESSVSRAAGARPGQQKILDLVLDLAGSLLTGGRKVR